MSAVRMLCDDADDNAGTAPAADRLRAALNAASANRWAMVGLLSERDISRRASAAWKGLARMLRREIGDLETELQDAEHRAREAARDAHVTAEALAIGAARKDALESRIRDLDAANSALLVERQRMQADLLRVDAERLDMHDEATSLLTRARSAERRCVEQDAELLGRAVTIASLQYDLDGARGHAAADRIRASMRLADMQAQRDREATRANNAEAACRDATGALVKAEKRSEDFDRCEASEFLYENTLEALAEAVDGRFDAAEDIFASTKESVGGRVDPRYATGYFFGILKHMRDAAAKVERTRECVRRGLAACSDEEIMAEHVRRFLASGGI